MRLIFSQANKHCPPWEGGHPRCQWRQVLSKANQIETSGALMLALQLAAQTSQSSAKKALLLCRLQAPAKRWHFSLLCGSYSVPLSPHPCA